MLRLIDVEWQDTRFYQAVLAEGEGMGRREGEADMLVRILRRRLAGPLHRVLSAGPGLRRSVPA